MRTKVSLHFISCSCLPRHSGRALLQTTFKMMHTYAHAGLNRARALTEEPRLLLAHSIQDTSAQPRTMCNPSNEIVQQTCPEKAVSLPPGSAGQLLRRDLSP